METYEEPKEEIISDEEDSNLKAIANLFDHYGEQNIDADDFKILNEILDCPNDETNTNIPVETDMVIHDEENENSQILPYEYDDDEQISFSDETLPVTFSRENRFPFEELQIRESDSSKSNNLTTNMDENSFTCKTCNKQFASISTLKAHEITHTKKKRMFQCAVCGKQLSRKRNLIRHHRIHSGDKPYACPTCGKKFASKGYIKYHLRIHTGEKPHVCPICNNIFSHRSSLIAHLRSHAKDEPIDERDVSPSYFSLFLN